MKAFIAAAPLAVWMVLAMPFYCHHGLTTVWSTSGHVHQSDTTAETNTSDIRASGPHLHERDSGPTWCRQPGPAGTTALTFASVDSSADLSNRFPVYDEQPDSNRAESGFHRPFGIASSPLERPPSYTA